MPKTALVVVDVLNTYDFPDAEHLVASAAAAGPRIRALVDEARERGVPVVYVNDALGDWSGDLERLIAKVLDGEHPELVRDLVPPEDASFIKKARHSIFYETPLDHLLRDEEISRIVLCGQVTEQCILYSALDAHVRQFECVIARDACASIDDDLAEAAFRMMHENMAAEVVESSAALDRALSG